MAYTNNYKPPEDLVSLEDQWGPKPYDINWCFPLHEATLKSDRVTLTPFIPRLHAAEYLAQVTAHPELQRYLPFDTPDMPRLLARFDQIRRDPAWVLFAVRDDTQGGALAGVIGLLKGAPAQLSAEIGWVVVFPAYQRTHVGRHAVGILLRYCLLLPSEGGLGLRRVQWCAHAANGASRGAALRMGFREEGVLRWERVVSAGKEGNGKVLRAEDPQKEHPGRDTVVLSICADDWENGGREHVQQVMDRE
ncbi:acyl-CoA N-acyltransferase [Gloeopeniophorella convolvens]|nr:acyl-CoA N-acyltransferase [Gloeopeniophorella convolvens]